MKSVVVMSSLPDIVFFWADEAFTEHLNKMSLAAGFISEDYNEATVDINAALQFFSPLVASQRYMSDVNNPYSSITCGNGMMIVIDQKDDFVYVVLNGDGQESEEFLKRKLRVFKYISGFHFGPYTERLKPMSSTMRKELWNSLSNVLTTFCFLCSQQQSFLVEANEMIQVNQVLSEKSIHLLEDVLHTAHKEGDPQAKHAMLLVNSKVLALYSSNQARKLQAPDIMMLITLVRSKFPHPDQSIPLSVNKTPAPLAYKTIRFQDVHIKPSAELHEQDDAEQDLCGKKILYGEVRSTNLEIKTANGLDSEIGPSEEYYPAYGTLEEGESSGSSRQNSKNASNESVTSEKYYTPDDELSSKYFSDYESNSYGTSSSKSSRETNSSNSDNDHDNELYRQRIFLRPMPSIYIPHTVHCLQISPGTVLVIISEVKRGELAKDMCALIAILSDFIEDKPTTQETASTVNLVERMELHIRKISEGLKGNSAMEKALEVYVGNIRQKWEAVKTHDILGYLQSRPKQRLSPKLDRALVDMTRSLTALFGAVYCSGKTVNGPSISIHHAKALYRIQESVQKELNDYKAFLSVKGERNFTMTRYLEEFPGLVHFIYIDRTANRIISPSINTDHTKIYNCRDPAHFIKQSIWDGWNYLQTFLVLGHTSVAARYGDFLFTYLLWFEDSSGNQRTIKDPNAFVKEFPNSPGIIGSNFYSELKRRCFPSVSQDRIYCYELFCMHLGILPLSQVSGHSRRLAAMLWETSGEANLPMFLVA